MKIDEERLVQVFRSAFAGSQSLEAGVAAVARDVVGLLESQLEHQRLESRRLKRVLASLDTSVSSEVPKEEVILEEISREFGIPIPVFTRPTRGRGRPLNREASHVRFAAMVAMKRAGMIHVDVAKAVGVSDHTAVTYGIKNFETAATAGDRERLERVWQAFCARWERLCSLENERDTRRPMASVVALSAQGEEAA